MSEGKDASVNLCVKYFTKLVAGYVSLDRWQKISVKLFFTGSSLAGG